MRWGFFYAMEISFKSATETDLNTCVEMMEAFNAIDHYPFNRAESEKNFHEFISSPVLGRFWLLQADEGIIGYLILTFGYSFEYGGRDAFIDEF